MTSDFASRPKGAGDENRNLATGAGEGTPPPHPHREMVAPHLGALEVLERENAQLRTLVGGLFLLVLLLGGMAAWWFGLLCNRLP